MTRSWARGSFSPAEVAGQELSATPGQSPAHSARLGRALCPGGTRLPSAAAATATRSRPASTTLNVLSSQKDLILHLLLLKELLRCSVRGYHLFAAPQSRAEPTRPKNPNGLTGSKAQRSGIRYCYTTQISRISTFWTPAFVLEEFLWKAPCWLPRRALRHQPAARPASPGNLKKPLRGFFLFEELFLPK